MAYYQVGQYKATIEDLCTGVSKNKNTPYVQIVIKPFAMIDVVNNTETPSRLGCCSLFSTISVPSRSIAARSAIIQAGTVASATAETSAAGKR